MTPQQNDVAEKMNRTIKEWAWSMIVYVGLPLQLWGVVAISLINSSPSSALYGDIPDEVQYGKMRRKLDSKF